MKRKVPTASRFLRCLLLLLSTLASLVRADQYCETVPPGVWRFVGCNLSIASISFPGNQLNKFNSGYTLYAFDPDDLIWTPNNPTPITRGDASVIRLASSNQVCFNEPTNGPVLPLSIATGYTTRASCQSNVVARFEDIVGRAPVEGTILYKLRPGGDYVWIDSTNYFVFTYTNSQWSPSTPTANIGEGVLIYQSSGFTYQPVALNPRIAGGNFSFELETVYGKPVTIEYSETLPAASWQELTSFTGTGHRRTVTDSSDVNGNSSRFYRIRMTP